MAIHEKKKEDDTQALAEFGCRTARMRWYLSIVRCAILGHFSALPGRTSTSPLRRSRILARSRPLHPISSASIIRP